jgi:hypothetical protein
MKVTNDSSSELVPEGTHPARLVQIVDYGTQAPKNPKHKPARKVSLGWEIIDDDLLTGEDGDMHFLAFRRFPLKVSSGSHLGKILKSWLGITVPKGEDYELKDLLDEPCLITVEHVEGDDGNTYANVTAVVAPPKGMKVGKSERDEVYFSLDDFDQDVFDNLPDFVQETIMESEEYKDQFGDKKKKKGGKDSGKSSGKPSNKRSRKEEEEEEEEEEEDDEPRNKKKKALPKGKKR